MKRILVQILLFAAGGGSAWASPYAQVIRFEEVAGYVSSQNLTVLSTAERVYQARDGIRVARGNLLPRLNLWRVVGAALDPKSLLGAIEDIVPFLAPANWSRVRQAERFSDAQRQAYAALWANEVMTAKSLYLQAELDRSLLELTRSKLDELEELRTIAKAQEVLGGKPESLSKRIAIEKLALEEDARSLSRLLSEEMSALRFALGFPAEADLLLEPIASDRVSVPSMPAKALAFEQAISRSPEASQYVALIEASKSIRREVRLSFLGVSNLSRGVQGGVFDSLPLSQGLGFGTGASLRISKRETTILELQKKGIEESLKRTASITIDSLELDRESLESSTHRLALTRSLRKDFDVRLRLGEAIEALEIFHSMKAVFDAESSDLVVRFRVLSSKERLERLLLEGDYASPPRLD